MIGGNIKAVVQIVDNTQKNSIGEAINAWVSIAELTGWLDYNSGESKYNTFNRKTEETTHIFICDYAELKKMHLMLDTNGNKVTDNKDIAIQTETGANDLFGVTNENTRLVINGEKYDVLLIDNPMQLNQHLEIYLKYTGGDANV